MRPLVIALLGGASMLGCAASSTDRVTRPAKVPSAEKNAECDRYAVKQCGSATDTFCRRDQYAKCMSQRLYCRPFDSQCRY